MDENTFEGFRWYLLFILIVFWRTKTRLKVSNGICFWFWALSVELINFWSLRVVFDINCKRFRINKNTFEAFGCYLLLILSVFGWTKTLFEAFAFYLLSILGVFRWTKTLLRVSGGICFWFWAFSNERKHFWRLPILFAIDFRRFQMDENTFEGFRWYLLLILSVFWWTKTLLKASHSICYRF